MSDLNQSLLWRCQAVNGNTSFLFGTMHVKDPRAFIHLDILEEKIASTDSYYSELELTVSTASSLEFIQHLPEGKALNELMDLRKYMRLREMILKSFGIDIDYFQNYYPMIVANIIQTSVLTQKSDLILDFYLHKKAKDLDKELCFLESQKTQAILFQQIPLEYQLKALLALGRQPEKIRHQMNTLMKDYELGNTRQLYQRTRKQLGKLRHKLLYARNIQMAMKLKSELLEKSGFIGVGAAHLYGYKGILRLLKTAGFRLSPEPLFID